MPERLAGGWFDFYEGEMVKTSAFEAEGLTTRTSANLNRCECPSTLRAHTS